MYLDGSMDGSIDTYLPYAPAPTEVLPYSPGPYSTLLARALPYPTSPDPDYPTSPDPALSH